MATTNANEGPVGGRPRLRTANALIASLFAFAGTAGCGDTPEAPALEAVVRDSAGVAIHEFPAAAVDLAPPLRLADTPEVRIGVVAGAPEYQWTRPVAATRLSDGAFAVLEQVPGEIRLYDAAGAFIGRIGRSGEGPGEFQSPVGLQGLAGDTLVVWDPRARRVSRFTRDGELVAERTLRDPAGVRSIRKVTLSRDGGMFLLGAETAEFDEAMEGRVREVWQVVPLEGDGEAEASVGTTPGTERAINIGRSGSGEIMSVEVRGRWWWGEGFAWPAADGGVWTADRLAFETRHFDATGGLDRILRIQAEDRPFTPALIDSLHGVELERVSDPELQVRWRADFELREYPPGVPPVAAIFADEAGRVWIGRTAPPPERLPSGEWTAVNEWIVFDGGAAWGRLTLPPRSRPLQADAEGVLLVRNDSELDVAYIEWYRWTADAP